VTGAGPVADKMVSRSATTMVELRGLYLGDVKAGRLLTRRKFAKKESALLMPVSSCPGLVDLSDGEATEVQVLFYADAADKLRKVLREG
jgi:hypothetical protein